MTNRAYEWAFEGMAEERARIRAARRAARRVRIYIEPRDIWVGVYVAPGAVYVCPLPFLVIKIRRQDKGDHR